MKSCQERQLILNYAKQMEIDRCSYGKIDVFFAVLDIEVHLQKHLNAEISVTKKVTKLEIHNVELVAVTSAYPTN